VKVSLDQLKSLAPPRMEIEFHETLSGTDAVKPVVGELTVSASSTGMRLVGRIQTLLKLNCDRCLRPYFHIIAVEIDERFVIAHLNDYALEKEKELRKAEDFVETLPPDNTLDISDVVYQAVTLAAPTTCLCGDQCPGPQMPTKSGKKASLSRDKDARKGEKPIDPRWKNLKSLFPNEDRETKS
jgi:uncharacterized metal-binding protein YceD (DUF177 family)